MLDFTVTFAITIVNLLILFLILRKILFKPVSKLMEDRARRISDTIAKAEQDTAEAKQFREQYEKKLAGGDAEAETIIKSAREHAQFDAEKIKEEARREAERIVAAARTRAESERQAAMVLFKAEAAALVVGAAGKLLRRELAGEEQLRFAREALRDMES